MASPSQTLHWAQTISNTTWGHQLSFHPFTRGDAPVQFSSLWPDKSILVATYKEANLGQCVYDLCKLLLVTNSDKSLDALLEDHVLMINHIFDPGKTTLAHLACALGSMEIVSVLMRRAANGNNSIWTQKDDEDHIPIDVCFVQKVRQQLPSRSLFARKKVAQGLPLKSEDRDKIFLMSRNPDDFYKTIINLQIFSFDVNRERNSDGDLLIHVAVKGGLPQLPLLYALVSIFKADVRLRNADGLTPLCLAAKCGEEKLAEVLICAFGADINASCGQNASTPLHYAVQNNHPRLVSMLVRRGADAACEDKNGCEPSFIARRVKALECHQIISQHLLERTERLATQANNGTLEVSQLYPSDAFLVCSNGCTLIMMAAMNNRTEVLQQLVRMDNSPLDFKQMKSCDTSLNSSLSRSFGEVTDEENSLKTAVHLAAERGYHESLKILIDAGAHPAIADAAAWLPIHYACDNGHLKCVEVIISFPNQLGLSGLRPAYDIAKGNNYDKIANLLKEAMEKRQTELINPLLFEVAHSGNKDLLFKILENGDDVNPTNDVNDWPLLLAAGNGYIDLVTQLLEFGGHATRRHKISRSTPLHVAARGGHAAVVRYLLRLCRPIEGDKYYLSPLPAGANDGDDVVPQYLDINSRNTQGATPLELAASQGHLEVVRLLLDHGASTTLPDSNGQLINIPSFAGTQFLIETSRKHKRKRIMSALQNKLPLKEFRKIWQGPSDFNLCSQNGDSILMIAAQFAGVEVMRYLLDSAKSCQPNHLVSPGQPPTLQSFSSSQSEESFSENSLPRRKRMFQNHSLALQPTHRRALSAHEYEGEEEEDSDDRMPPERWSAIGGKSKVGRSRGGGHNSDIPGISSPQRERLLTDLSTRSYRRKPAAGRQASRQLPMRATVGPHPPLTAVHNKSTTTPSSEEDSKPTAIAMGNRNAVTNGNAVPCCPNGAAVSDSEAFSEEFTSLVHYVNPRNGHTLLHRAAEGCQSDNVTLLLRTDDKLANIQDNYGNTALQIACTKAHKPTVKAFLSFDCVSTSVRNNNGELPETACLKSAIKKLVCKQRTKQIGNDLPSPPQWRGRPEGLPSVERAPPNGLPVAIASQISPIPENPSQTASSDPLSMSQFEQRMAELKTQVKQSKQ